MPELVVPELVHTSTYYAMTYVPESLLLLQKKGLSFISNRQRRKEGAFGALKLAGIEPTPPAQEEQDMPAFANYARGWTLHHYAMPYHVI